MDTGICKIADGDSELWWERKWVQGELVSPMRCYSQEQGTCSLSGGGGREVSTQLGCKWFRKHHALEPGPIALASFPLGWRQSGVRGSGRDERRRRTKV